MSSYYEKFLATGEVKCIDDEIPFEIPKGWEWTRIRNISQSYIGLTYSPTDVSSRGTIVLRSSNIQDGKIVLNDVVRVSKEISEKLQVEKNDIIICARNGSAKLVGKSAVVTDVTEPMTFGAFMAICKTALYQYVSIFLQSDLFFSQLRGVSGTTTINQLTQNNFNDFWIPIPPANEQKRIVEKLQNVSPFIERYSKSQETLNLMNIQIKEQLKKSILQEAIQGKLVPQIAEEGTAQELLEQIQQEKQKLVKEGKLKKSVLTDSVIYKGDDNKYYEQIGKKCLDITDEIPFVIPETWQWVRIRDVFQLNPKNEAEDEKLVAFIPMEKISAGYKSDFTFDTTKWGTIKKGFTHFANGDVAFAKITPCFQNRKSAIFHDLPNGIGAGTTELKVLRPYGNTIDRWYLLYFLESPYFIDEATFKGTANQQRIVVGYLEDKLFPLPTQKEQQRIVAQIENLFEQLH